MIRLSSRVTDEALPGVAQETSGRHGISQSTERMRTEQLSS